MPTNPNIPNFPQRRQRGKCPACDHHGSDCKCHKEPKKAAEIFVERQMEMALTCIATAGKVALDHKLKANALSSLSPAEIGNTYVDVKDRFVVSLIVGFGRK